MIAANKETKDIFPEVPNYMFVETLAKTKVLEEQSICPVFMTCQPVILGKLLLIIGFSINAREIIVIPR